MNRCGNYNENKNEFTISFINTKSPIPELICNQALNSKGSVQLHFASQA